MPVDADVQSEELQRLYKLSVHDEHESQSESQQDDSDEDEELSSLLKESVLESVLYGLVVDCDDVSDCQV